MSTFDDAIGINHTQTLEQAPEAEPKIMFLRRGSHVVNGHTGETKEIKMTARVRRMCT